VTRCLRHHQSTERRSHGRRQLLQLLLRHDDVDGEAEQDAMTEWRENAAGGGRCCSWRCYVGTWRERFGTKPTPETNRHILASCLLYARALLEYVIVIVRVRSVNKMSPSVKLAEDKVLTFLILGEKCKVVQL